MVEIKSLSLAYPTGDTVLKDISLTIEDGECVLFTGESGSGKSTLLNVVNGLAYQYEGCATQGTVRLDGQDTKGMELYEISQLISSVFQNPKTHFFNIDTTLELLFFLENIGVSRADMTRRLEQMLQVFPIYHLLNRNIFDLSGGEKQILCVAASYISGVKTIVLDEPSSNLDERYTSVLANMLKILKKKGMTILVAEHRLYYLMEIVDRVIVLQDGEILKIYTKKAFLALEAPSLYAMGLRSTVKEPLVNREQIQDGAWYIKELSYLFPRKDKMLCVKDLYLAKGRIYGIIGDNGQGKSTFIRALIGLVKRAKDEIYYEGERLSKKKRLKMAGWVMQDVGHQLFSDSVENEMTLGNDRVDPQEIQDVLAVLGLAQFGERHPMSLSGGQKQRVAIAQTILSHPLLVCFDEPTSGMDYRNMVKISELIKTMVTEENVVLIISHDTEFLNTTVDDIIDISRYCRAVE